MEVLNATARLIGQLCSSAGSHALLIMHQEVRGRLGYSEVLAMKRGGGGGCGRPQTGDTAAAVAASFLDPFIGPLPSSGGWGRESEQVVGIGVLAGLAGPSRALLLLHPIA